MLTNKKTESEPKKAYQISVVGTITIEEFSHQPSFGVEETPEGGIKLKETEEKSEKNQLDFSIVMTESTNIPGNQKFKRFLERLNHLSGRFGPY